MPQNRVSDTITHVTLNTINVVLALGPIAFQLGNFYTFVPYFNIFLLSQPHQLASTTPFVQFLQQMLGFVVSPSKLLQFIARNST